MSEQQVRKAVIYCRVSTKEQAEEGNSLNTQQKICTEYAQKNNYKVSAVFIEKGESAKTADRTELKKLIAFCATKKNKISAVISYKIDRISRNTDDYSQIRILLRRYGVEIKSTSEHFEDTPAGRFMENIIANVAQFDNDVRAERCSTGMKDAVREGRYVWLAPLGYSNVRVNGKATIAPNIFAPIIRQTFEAIALDQSSIEVTRKEMRDKGLIMQNGNPVSRSYFYRLIKNELYAGWINKFGERHKGSFEQIVSDEIFSKVQMIVTRNQKKQFSRVSDNPDFPLRRFFRHPSGKLLTGAWSTGKTKKYAYYLIHGTGINIRKEQLEAVFQSWLNHFKMDINHFEKLFAYMKSELESTRTKRLSEKAKLESTIIELKAKQTKIINKNIDGIIDDELCKEKLQEINAELYNVQQSLLYVQDSSTDKDSVLKIIRDVLLHPGNLWKKADMNEKIKLQRFYFPDGIVIDKIGSRTHKICKLFKLKSLFSPQLSSMVDYRNPKSNIFNLQISLPSEEKGNMYDKNFIYEILCEVRHLKAALSPEKEDVQLPLAV